MTKPKTTQPKTKEVQGRDLFQTPNYAVDLLVPFIPIKWSFIWECAEGEGKISNRLREHKFNVVGTDIRDKFNWNFLSDRIPVGYYLGAIITNPPFSLKYDFIYKAIEYDLPFAFLIPFDMCGKMANLFMNYGCQGIVPTRRIDYITPTGLSGKTGHTAYYHSFWLTRKFNLKDQLVFVELTKEMKENI